MDNSDFIPVGQQGDPRVLEPVSSGATCETFKYQRWGRWFLLKRLKQDLRDAPVAIAAFEKEFDLGIHLDHPGLVRYFEKGEDEEGRAFIVEEYVDGETLTRFLRNHGPLSRKESRRIFIELADTVSYLHSVGIVHSDIKPDNIIITRQGCHPKLVDLGFSSQYSYAPLTGGTVFFSAPEQFSDGSDGDVRADIYSLGRVLEVLAPGRFRRVVRKATAEKAGDRYTSFSDMTRPLKRDSTIALILAALLVLSLLVPSVLRHSLWSPAAAPVRDTLYVRDTTRTVDTIVIMPASTAEATKNGPLELFSQEAGKEIKSLFDPFYASYSHLTGANFEQVQARYLQTFESARRKGLNLATSWAEEYPDLAEEFCSIAMDELLQVIRKYQNDLMAVGSSSSGD